MVQGQGGPDRTADQFGLERDVTGRQDARRMDTYLPPLPLACASEAAAGVPDCPSLPSGLEAAWDLSRSR